MISRMLKKLDIGKAVGPDDVSGHFLTKCIQQFSGPITDVIKYELKPGKAAKEWR